MIFFIALYKKLPGRSSGDCDIHLFTGSGRRFNTIPGIAKDISLIAWTQREDIVRVAKSGLVTVYNWSGDVKNDFSFQQDIVSPNQISDAKKFDSKHGTGVAILTTNFQIFLVNNVYDPKIRKLPPIPGAPCQPSNWCVLPPDLHSKVKETVILVSKDTNMYFLNPAERNPTLINLESVSGTKNIIQSCFSFQNHNLALLDDTGDLWMGTFESNVLTKKNVFVTKTKKEASQLLWAGPSAIVGLWKDILLVVGFDGEFINFVVERPAHLVSEVDGLRIIGNDRHEFLQQIPGVIIDIFRIGSLAAGTLLLEASKEFFRKSHKADEYMKILRDRNEMELAVSQCIEAAGHEFSVSDQKLLLRAASFGKCFSPQANRDNFVNTCQTLRVLNNIRRAIVGISLSWVQFELLSRNVLLDRLIVRRDYDLAMSIASYLKMSASDGTLRILSNWASRKVQEVDLTDDEVSRIIRKKLGDTPGLSYADIANEAIKRGRRNLALKLASYEMKPSKQVPLLLALDEKQNSIERAISSGDTHLIYAVIYRLRQSLSSRDFTMMIRNFPTAYTLYQKMCREEDEEKLRAIYYQEDDFNSEAYCWVSQSYKSSSREQRIQCLQSAVAAFRKSRNDFMVTTTEEQVKLLRMQIKLEEKSHIQCLDLSVQETLKKLLLSPDGNLAEAFRKEFKVPDKRFWWLKITILSELQEWIQLEKFSQKKSPIGFEARISPSSFSILELSVVLTIFFLTFPSFFHSLSLMSVLRQAIVSKPSST